MPMSAIDLDSYANHRLHRLKFSLLFSFQIPAYLLSLLIFCFFIKNTRTLSMVHNQALLILLLINFAQLSITLPMNLHFYAKSYVRPATPQFCHWWIFIEFTLYSVSEYLMATISVQRHMLVFHGQWMRTRRMRFLLHHFPLVLAIIYPTLFYFCAIILYPCDGNQYNYHQNLCGFIPCYLRYNKNLGSYDWSVNNGLPMMVNALANILLVMRVVRQKLQHHRTINWKQQRRLTIQLFCISSLYIIAWFPCLVVALVQILGHRTFMAEIQTNYFLDLIYLVCLLLPWISLGLVPEFRPWVKSLCCRRTAIHVMHTSTQLPASIRTRLHP